MPKPSPRKPPTKPSVESVLAELKKKSTQRDRDNMERFGIVAPKSFGTSMANLKTLAKALGRDHALAAALWETGWYEARMLATLVDDPAEVTPAQMERWRKDFDNWGITDTACFCLFDRSPHAWAKVAPWCALRDEWGKRAGFVLLACLAAHDKQSPDAPFLEALALIEPAATDERNFVKKGVNWALRAVGERSPATHAAALEIARRLAESANPAARWNGKDALRQLATPAVRKRLEKRRAAAAR